MELSTIDKKIRSFSEINPDKIAVKCGKRSISYRNLEQNSSTIARFLMDHCSGSDNVYVILDKSIELINAMLGIIKGGKVFIPMDHTTSSNRTISMLQEIKAQWVITSHELLGKVSSLISKAMIDVNILIIDSGDANNSTDKVFYISDYSEDINKKYEFCQNKNCYIYFTSGSAGKPKAVLGRHKSLVQFIEWEINEFSIDDTSVVSQLTPMTFDPFLRDVFVPLLSGGTLCIPDEKEIILEPKRLLSWIRENNITIIHIVPSLFKRLSQAVETIEDLGDLKYIFLAGELLRGNDIKRILNIAKENIQLVNLYGPTETTLAKFFYRIKYQDGEKSIIPVGRPISACQCYILDKDLKECADNVVGEIYIRTPYISSGYCNDKELTKRSFFRNFFTNNPNDIIYKTGDHGRRLSDKNIEVIGRVDNQVKIRGMRIEIGEIENVILKIDGIKEVKVVADEDEEGNKFLSAYLLVGDNFICNEIRNNLKELLPDYMIPSNFISVNNMPLNNNGKIDIKRLREIGGKMISEEDYAPPTNDTERTFAAIWEKVLKLNKVGINDDFFHIGGHSLKAISIVTEAKKEGIDINIRDIFEYTTIKDISKQILNSKNKTYITNTKDEIIDRFRQKGLNIHYKTVESYNFLLVSGDGKNNINLIEDMIDDTINPKIRPHYIKSIGEKVRINEIEDAKLIDEIFNEQSIEELLETHKYRLENAIEFYRKELLSKKVIREYPLSGAQKIRLENNETITVVIKLEEKYSEEFIKNSLLKVINEQSLLRSTYSLDNEEYLWKEYGNINEIDIPVFDLSDVSFYKAEDVYNTIMKNIEELAGTELIRVILVKKNLVEQELVLIFNHIIFDGYSRQVLKSRFKEILLEKEMRGSNLQYYDYVKNIIRGPQLIAEELIISDFNLENFSLAVSEMNNALKDYDNSCNVFLELTLDSENKDKSINYFKVIYGLFKDMLKKYFSMNKLPVLLINYGRKYSNQEYYNCIGEFIDYAPFLIEDNCELTEDLISKQLSLLSEKNINFSELSKNKNLKEKYPRINNLLENIFNNTLIVFNFQVMMDNEEFKLDEKYAGNEKLILFNCKVYDEIVKLQINLPFKDIKKIEIEDYLKNKYGELIN
jgi:amino acid adenylation domain-containing protein